MGEESRHPKAPKAVRRRGGQPWVQRLGMSNIDFCACRHDVSKIARCQLAKSGVLFANGPAPEAGGPPQAACD